MSVDASEAERKLVAAEKTIAALMRRVETQVSSGDSAFGVLEQNIALERVVKEKTRLLESERAALQAALDELKRTQTELMQAQKLESVGRLAAGIAHEINTPIQFVNDSTVFLRDAFRDLVEVLTAQRALLAHADALPPALVEAVREAERRADLEGLLVDVRGALDRSLEGLSRVATIVRSMKEFAHPDQRELAAADLNRALDTTLTIARNEYKYVATVETDFGPLPPVCCNIGEMNQVFLIVIVNAAHAIESVHGSTGQGVIGVVTRQQGEEIVVAISDNGPGIPEAIRDRVYDPFFTTKQVGKGTGQGLSIARKVVNDMHGGSLTFTTETGKGTTFRIQLPIEPRRPRA